jgi:hypothetical protein
MKLSGQCFEMVSGIKKDLQAALESITENCFHGGFEVQKKYRCVCSK